MACIAENLETRREITRRETGDIKTMVKFTWKKAEIEFAYSAQPDDKEAILAEAVKCGHLSVTARTKERDRFYSNFMLALVGLDGEKGIGTYLTSEGKPKPELSEPARRFLAEVVETQRSGGSSVRLVERDQPVHVHR